VNTRRQFVAGAACAALALQNRILKGESAMKEITLAPLPYADDALAPTVSAKTISFHYGKHHAGYVKVLKTSTETTLPSAC
jgi:Fe-Mn family superoxide dismutase